MKTPADLKRLEKTVAERIRRECPEVAWRGSYAVLGPCDYLDLFEAPNEDRAAKGPAERLEVPFADEQRIIADRYLGEKLGGHYLAANAAALDEEILVVLRPERWWSVDCSQVRI